MSPPAETIKIGCIATSLSHRRVATVITEHYWGYAAQPDGGSLEYEVAHAPWRVWTATQASFEGAPAGLYGPELARCLNGAPDSAFLAEGSAVKVYPGQRVG